MIRGLVEKELRQHAVALCFLFLGMAGGDFLLAASHRLSTVSGTPLEGFAVAVSILAPLICFLLAQILIVGEYRHKTQLFLEGLPLARWRMLTVKYALGLSVVLISVTAALGIALAVNAGRGAITARFLLILISRAFIWSWFAYAVFFLHGFFGRYRMFVAMCVFIVIMLLIERGVTVSRFCALELVDNSFAFEDRAFPTAALWQTAALAAGATALGFWLALLRDATVASLLAERMSAREKFTLSFICVGCAMGASYLHDKNDNGEPVALAGSFEIDRGPIHVAATPAVDAPSSAELAASRKIATDVAEDLAAAADYLSCSAMPPIFIVHRRDFKGDHFENGDLKSGQGLMVRANLTAPDFHEPLLQRWLLREIFLVKSKGRADLEKNAWVLDGFPLWWSEHQGAHASLATPSPELEQARSAMPQGFSTETLGAWYRVRKSAGAENAQALAWTGLSTLAATHGGEACRQFLASMLSRDFTKDARGWLRDVWNPPAHRFHTATGVDLVTFVGEWRAALTAPSPIVGPVAPSAIPPTP